MKRTGGFVLGLLVGAIMTALWGRYAFDRFTPTFVEQPISLDVQDRMDDLAHDIDALATTGTQYIYQKYAIIDALLHEGYYDEDKIDISKMQENAFKGYVDALGDPYTTYMTTDENTMFDEEMQGSRDFEGIGAVVVKKEDGVLIEQLLKGFPAYKAGLQPLDLILEIDGTSTKTLDIHEAVKLIRGPEGTEVNLTIYREEDNEILDMTVTREHVNIPSVTGHLIGTGDTNILYIDIAVIGEDTLVGLRDVLATYRPQAEGIILDLRGNGGGYLPLAIEVASFFVPKNEIITTARYSTLPDEVYRSKGYADVHGLPLVVLVNGMSASASEIIAGAVRQRGDAVIVGTQTFGKGSIQTLATIEDGSSLKYTVGNWYLPDDTNVDEVGLTPDREVAFDLAAYASGDVDNQLERAIEEMKTLQTSSS